MEDLVFSMEVGLIAESEVGMEAAEEVVVSKKEVKQGMEEAEEEEEESEVELVVGLKKEKVFASLILSFRSYSLDACSRKLDILTGSRKSRFHN